jgi:hypothetical protein
MPIVRTEFEINFCWLKIYSVEGDGDDSLGITVAVTLPVPSVHVFDEQFFLLGFADREGI